MAIKDRWIFQERETDDPWAFYVVREVVHVAGEKRTYIDITFYSENVENATHSESRIGLHYESVTGYVDEMLSIIAEYASLASEDKEQLYREMSNILI